MPANLVSMSPQRRHRRFVHHERLALRAYRGALRLAPLPLSRTLGPYSDRRLGMRITDRTAPH
jgi:hypothetical protein